jgi:hypothetical protein
MKAILGLILLVLNILAIVDCVKSSKSGGQKALWIVLILVLPYAGAIAYFLIGKKK